METCFRGKHSPTNKSPLNFLFGERSEVLVNLSATNIQRLFLKAKSLLHFLCQTIKIFNLYNCYIHFLPFHLGSPSHTHSRIH